MYTLLRYNKKLINVEEWRKERKKLMCILVEYMHFVFVFVCSVIWLHCTYDASFAIHVLFYKLLTRQFNLNTRNYLHQSLLFSTDYLLNVYRRSEAAKRGVLYNVCAMVAMHASISFRYLFFFSFFISCLMDRIVFNIEIC